jgi:hypothetical protein
LQQSSLEVFGLPLIGFTHHPVLFVGSLVTLCVWTAVKKSYLFQGMSALFAVYQSMEIGMFARNVVSIDQLMMACVMSPFTVGLSESAFTL